MVDESNVLPPSRLVRWAVLGALIVIAVALYFRDGRRVPPLGGGPAAPTAPESTTARSPD